MKRTEKGLRSTRVRRKLTQKALAEATGLQQETISRLEREGPGRGVVQAIQLARGLEASVEDLFGGFAPPAPSTAVLTQGRERKKTG